MTASYAVLLAMLALASLRTPAAAVAAVVCMFGLEQWGQTSGATLAAGATFTNYAIGCIVLVALGVSVARGKCLVCGLPATYWLIVAFFVYAFLSMFWSPDPVASMERWRLAFPYLITVIVLTPLACSRVEEFASALRILIIVGGSLCVATLFFGNWGYRGLIVPGRFHTMEANPLAIASVAGQVLLTAALFPLARNRLLRWAVVIVLVPVCLSVVVRSGSRGQLLAVLTALAVAWPLARRGAVTLRLLVVPAILAALGFIAFLSLDYFGGVADRWQYDQASEAAEGRANMAFALLAVAARDPGSLLFGLGNSAAFQIVGFYPHVVPLEILAEEGVLGFGLFIAILAVAVVPALRAFTRPNMSATARAACAALLASLVFHLMLSFKQGSALGSTLLFMHAVLLHRLAVAKLTVRRPSLSKEEQPTETPVPMAGNTG